MLELPGGFRGVAPDLRGYGLSPQEAIIDATRGVGDWVDDAFALLEAFKVERFHLVGHSLGGMVCWGLLADPRFAHRIASATLVAPAPPYGFGGVHGSEAQPNNPDFSGSGAGLVHSRMVDLIAQGERGISDPYLSPRAVMNRMFWKPPFRAAREEAFLSALLQVHLGERQFPGDSVSSEYWPGFAPGRFGPINALSAKYNRHLTRGLLDSPAKPPLMVVIGDGDPVISDASQPDAGFQGKQDLGLGGPATKRSLHSQS
jgi:pimeloyl-ACP methyl ester carboxylesterase